MAAITQPRGFGAHAGRRYGSFANKAGASVVAGPYCVAEAQIFTAAARKGDVFTAGVSKAQTFTAGTRKAQTCCEG